MLNVYKYREILDAHFDFRGIAVPNGMDQMACRVSVSNDFHQAAQRNDYKKAFSNIIADDIRRISVSAINDKVNKGQLANDTANDLIRMVDLDLETAVNAGTLLV